MNPAEKSLSRLLTATCRAAQQSTDPAKREAGANWEKWIARKLAPRRSARRSVTA